MDTEGKVKVADQFWHRDMELGALVEICGCELGTVPRQGDPSREVGRDIMATGIIISNRAAGGVQQTRTKRARKVAETTIGNNGQVNCLLLKQRTEHSRVRRTSLPITDLSQARAGSQISPNCCRITTA
jgi:hypothetical protein